MVKKYNIFYKKYSFVENCKLLYCKVVETENIYEEVGKLVLKSYEEISDIWFCEHKNSSLKDFRHINNNIYALNNDILRCKDCDNYIYFSDFDVHYCSKKRKITSISSGCYKV